ncbi:TPA: hypothetical protein ACSP3W_004325 [Aeromonas veronii]
MIVPISSSFLLEALRDALAQAIVIQPAVVSPHQEKMRVEMKVET